MPAYTPDLKPGIDSRVRDIVTSECRRLGVRLPDLWGTVAPCLCGCGKGGNADMLVARMETPWGERTIAFCSGAGFYERFPGDMIRGVVAHELGHIYYGDILNHTDRTPKAELHESEFRADRFAIQAGYAGGLSRSLLSMRDATNWDFDTDSHPATKTRVERLERWLTSQRNGAGALAYAA